MKKHCNSNDFKITCSNFKIKGVFKVIWLSGKKKYSYEFKYFLNYWVSIIQKIMYSFLGNKQSFCNALHSCL